MMYEAISNTSSGIEGICFEPINNSNKLKITFPNHISKELKDLLSKMLEENPEKRLNAQEALSHTFFTQSDTTLDTMTKNKQIIDSKTKIQTFMEHLRLKRDLLDISSYNPITIEVDRNNIIKTFISKFKEKLCCNNNANILTPIYVEFIDESGIDNGKHALNNSNIFGLNQE